MSHKASALAVLIADLGADDPYDLAIKLEFNFGMRKQTRALAHLGGDGHLSFRRNAHGAEYLLLRVRVRNRHLRGNRRVFRERFPFLVSALFFRHAGFAHTLVEDRLGEGEDGRRLVACVRPEPGDARPRTFPSQPPGFGELRGGAVGLAFEGIGGGEVAVDVRECLIRGARLLEPEDRIVDMRLQQMGFADPKIPICNGRIARAEAGGLVQERNSLAYRADVDLAPAESRQSPRRVAIERQDGLVLGNGLSAAALRSQQQALDAMRKRAVRRCGDGSCGQLLRALHIIGRRTAHKIQHAAHEHIGQQALGFGGIGIERQGTLEQADRLAVPLSREGSC